MYISEAMFRHQHQKTINQPLVVNREQLANSLNIVDIEQIQLVGELNYRSESRTLETDIRIQGTIIVECARTLKHFVYPIDFQWEDEYNFTVSNEAIVNFINDPKGFELDNYAIDEIIMHVPINLFDKNGTILSSGSSYQVMSEEDYDQYEEKRVDPRWEKLTKEK